jgi:hypothetical protein
MKRVPRLFAIQVASVCLPDVAALAGSKWMTTLRSFHTLFAPGERLGDGIHCPPSRIDPKCTMSPWWGLTNPLAA